MDHLQGARIVEKFMYLIPWSTVLVTCLLVYRCQCPCLPVSIQASLTMFYLEKLLMYLKVFPCRTFWKIRNIEIIF